MRDPQWHLAENKSSNSEICCGCCLHYRDLHTAYENIYTVYGTLMPGLLNINAICVHIISMLIRSITADRVSCHSLIMLIKQMELWGDDSDIGI